MTETEQRRKWIEWCEQASRHLFPFNRCSDYDDECVEVCNKTHCFLYDPEKGYCPFLSGELKN